MPAGYRGGVLKFSEPNMHEVLALRMSSPNIELGEFRRVTDIESYSEKRKSRLSPRTSFFR